MLPQILTDSPADFLDSYDSALKGLENSPNDLNYKHQAVLALARAGSSEFALAEYQRYGLGKVRQHEDIMALEGRLFKDLYFQYGDEETYRYARQSSEKYDAAYQSTGGYYSGLNAATMMLAAGLPQGEVTARARKVMSALPDLEAKSADEKYYIEASRAESFLLLGQPDAAKQAFTRAIQHNPVNYVAHASTLRQMSLISKIQNLPLSWLKTFTPPKSMHFASHLFGAGPIASTRDIYIMPERDIEILAIEVSDMIQKNDIGFGYGALAAGGDIVIAETLLDEGGELHAVLPCDPSVFLEISVRPFGEAWVPRFENCLAQARSVRSLNYDLKWPNTQLNSHAARIAMGQAILRSSRLSTQALQLVIWDGSFGNLGTAGHVADWINSGRAPLIINYQGERIDGPNWSDQNETVQAVVYIKPERGAPRTLIFDSALAAAQSACALRRRDDARIGISVHIAAPSHAGLSDMSMHKEARALAGSAVPGGIIISEDVAALLALGNSSDFMSSYLGRVSDKDAGDIRAFALTKTE